MDKNRKKINIKLKQKNKFKTEMKKQSQKITKIIDLFSDIC